MFFFPPSIHYHPLQRKWSRYSLKITQLEAEIPLSLGYPETIFRACNYINSSASFRREPCIVWVSWKKAFHRSLLSLICYSQKRYIWNYQCPSSEPLSIPDTQSLSLQDRFRTKPNLKKTTNQPTKTKTQKCTDNPNKQQQQKTWSGEIMRFPCKGQLNQRLAEPCVFQKPKFLYTHSRRVSRAITH